MKSKFLYFIIAIFAVFGITILVLQGLLRQQPKATVTLVDKQGIHVARQATASESQHQKDIRAIHQAGEHIRRGNFYDDTGQYEQAAGAYQNAYSVDRGSRAVSGLKLAMTYEKLARYDDAITLLDQMIQNGELSANGVKNANAIKSRLLAAKNQANQPAATS